MGILYGNAIPSRSVSSFAAFISAAPLSRNVNRVSKGSNLCTRLYASGSQYRSQKSDVLKQDSFTSRRHALKSFFAAATCFASAVVWNSVQHPVLALDGELQIQDLIVGTGAEAVDGCEVKVNYTGWLNAFGDAGGKQFDSSKGRRPLKFKLGSGMVIKGWDQGVVGMKVGGKRRLVIPSSLAYGSRSVGNGLIPANSTLYFEVELLGVSK
mmetsp:Transcript_5416/g.9554  ORF Transcript_5416/g.9554 Transcript_5416/m.9554 type:complete len:211 (-) Transcript_5416:931-1563(-)